MMTTKTLNLELLNVAAMLCILTEQEITSTILKQLLCGVSQTVSQAQIQFYLSALSADVLQELKNVCSRRGEVSAAATSVVAVPVQSTVVEKATTTKPKTEEEDLDLFF